MHHCNWHWETSWRTQPKRMRWWKAHSLDSTEKEKTQDFVFFQMGSRSKLRLPGSSQVKPQSNEKDLVKLFVLVVGGLYFAAVLAWSTHSTGLSITDYARITEARAENWSTYLTKGSHYSHVVNWSEWPLAWSNLTLASSRAEVIVWHRIPKTGGESMAALLDALKRSGNVESVIGLNAVRHFCEEIWAFAEMPLAGKKNRQWVYLVVNRRVKAKCGGDIVCLIHGHWPFVESWHTLLGNPSSHRVETRLISMVRHPIRRLESFFHYIRGRSGGWRAQTDDNARLNSAEVMHSTRNMTLSQCVNHQRNVCRLSVNYLVHWFCGRCGTASLSDDDGSGNGIDGEALRSAMHNVIDSFDTVLILEEFPMSAALMRSLFPQWFADASWSSFSDQVRHVSERQAEDRHSAGYHSYSPISETSFEWRKLAVMNQFDLTFYEWTRVRFYQQILALPDASEFVKLFPQLERIQQLS